MVPTADRNLRISVDLTIMNKYICFELHMLLCVEHMLGQLKDAKIFAKLDAQSGFGRSSCQCFLQHSSLLLVAIASRDSPSEQEIARKYPSS